MTTVSRGPGAWLARLVFGALLLLAGLIAVAYLAARFVLWPNIDSLATRYASTVEARLGVPLTWNSIRTEWSGARPSIEITAPVLGSGPEAVRAERLFGTISLRALLRGQADFHDLVLDRPVVPLVRSGDTVSLAVMPAPAQPSSTDPSAVGQWLLQQPDVRIGGGTLLIRDADDPRRNLRFEQVALVLRSSGREHDARLDVGNANGLAANLVVQAELTRKALADPADWRTWSGNLQWEARQLAVRPLLAQLPDGSRQALVERLGAVVTDSIEGRIDPWMSLQLAQGTIGEMRLRLRSDDLALMLADGRGGGAGSLRFTRIDAQLRARTDADGATEISASTLDLVEAGGARLHASVPLPNVTLSRDGARIERAAGGFTTIDLSPTLGLTKLLADSTGAGAVADTLQRLTGSGQLTDLKLAWQRGSVTAPGPWSARGSFAHASLDVAPTEHQVKFPWALRVPSIRNLSGSFEATDAGGKASLRTPPAKPAAQPTQPTPTTHESSMIRLGGLLVESEVPITALESQASWKVDPAAGAGWLTVLFDRVDFANADGKGSVSGRYQTGGRGAGVIDLRARIDGFQAKQAWRYLPYEVPQDVREWVRRAFEAGSLDRADVRWRGDIHDFPYRLKSQDGPGEFRFAAKLRDVLFKYDPAWPAIHGVNGDLVFERAAMTFESERAAILEVPLSGVKARIDDLKLGKLEVSGRAQGNAEQFLKFINGSPLVDTLGDVTRPMVAHGPATLELKLGLHLGNIHDVSVNGRVDLAGTQMEFAPAGIAVDGVNGGLEFTEKSLSINRLSGSFNGMPVKVSGQTTGADGMKLLVRGTLTADGLRRLTANPLTQRLRGATTYRAEVDFSPDGTRVKVESDLEGLASELPAPMAKTADARWPLKLTSVPIPPSVGAHLPGANAERIDASVGDGIHLSAERARGDSRTPMQLTRAALAINRQPALPDQGVSLQFTGQRIDLDAWLAVFSGAGDNPAAQGTKGVPSVPDVPGVPGVPGVTGVPGVPRTPGGVGSDIAALPLTVSLVADEVRVGDRNLKKVVLGASRNGTQWLANLSTLEVNGFLTWDDSATSPKLTARLGRLEIPESQQQEIAASLATGPSTLPAMDITAQQFILGGVNFGALELLARNTSQPASGGRPSLARAPLTPRVWRLERLRLTSPAAVLDAQGQWDRTTDLSYRLNVIDAGAFLDRLQLKDVVKGGKGALSGELHWNGAPFSMDLPTLGGTVDIEVRNGQFLKVEPGAAKLIGVLNLQALPKLLTLDFNDIFARGFSFDELRGSVAIDRGVATTDSLAMRGLQAVVQIKGQADLQASSQDLEVVVIPELNGGLATLAYAAIVNPAIGLGAFLAQSLFSQPLSKAFAHRINITGSWADPTVIERKRERVGTPQGE